MTKDVGRLQTFTSAFPHMVWLQAIQEAEAAHAAQKEAEKAVVPLETAAEAAAKAAARAASAADIVRQKTDLKEVCVSGLEKSAPICICLTPVLRFLAKVKQHVSSTSRYCNMHLLDLGLAPAGQGLTPRFLHLSLLLVMIIRCDNLLHAFTRLVGGAGS